MRFQKLLTPLVNDKSLHNHAATIITIIIIIKAFHLNVRVLWHNLKSADTAPDGHSHSRECTPSQAD